MAQATASQDADSTGQESTLPLPLKAYIGIAIGWAASAVMFASAGHALSTGVAAPWVPYWMLSAGFGVATMATGLVLFWALLDN